MENQLSVIYLTPFAPLIQLWAGICLLFFYCNLLDRSPFEKTKDKVYKQYKDIYEVLTTKYMVFLPSGKIFEVSDDSKKNKRWYCYRRSVYSMAIFCFFYASWILIFIGIENHSKWGEYYQSLMVSNVLAFLYYVLNTFAYKTFWGQNKLFAILCAIVSVICMLLYFLVADSISRWIVLDRTTISFYTLITCFIGVFLKLCHLFWEKSKFWKCENSISRIKKIFDKWTVLTLNKDVPRFSKYKWVWMVFRKMLHSIRLNEDVDFDKSYKDHLEACIKQQIENEITYLNKILELEPTKV